MNSSDIQKFINAVQDAGLTVWTAVTDMSTHFWNNPDQNQLIFKAGDGLAHVRFNRQQEGPGKVFMDYAAAEDIHEIRTSGSAREIKQILEAMGATVSDDDLKIMVAMQAAERDIIPPTGNYLRKDFIYLTEKQLERLSEEEREQYEIEKAEWEAYLKEKEKDIPGPIQVTLGYPY